MSRDDLRAMFADLTEDVAPTRPIATALRRAKRVRRRRTVLGSALVVALVAVLGAAVTRSYGPDHREAADPDPTSSQSTTLPSLRYKRVDHADQIEPQSEQPYLPASIAAPADAPSLAQVRLGYAQLLYAPPGAAAIYAYGSRSINGGSGDGTFGWVRLDVGRDAKLDPNSLGPMGRRAAFAQAGGIFVIDFLVNTSELVPLSFTPTQLTWLPGGLYLLATGPSGTVLVNVLTHESEPAAANGAAAVPLVGNTGSEGQHTLTLGPTGPLLTRYDVAGQHEEGRFLISDSGIDSLFGRGWQYGYMVAQASTIHFGQGPSQGIAVIDAANFWALYALDLGPGADPCCAVLGWRNESVVFRSSQLGLLAWNPLSGRVLRLAPPFQGELSLNVMNCPRSITIKGVTSGCIS